VEQAGQQDVNEQEDDERIEVARAPHHRKQLEDCTRRLINHYYHNNIGHSKGHLN
jgi:hypothetical protein